MKNIFLTISFFALFGGVLFAQEVSMPAPQFSLKDSSGVTHSLTGLKGKFVVLEWYNPDCPFVKKHYSSGNMQALQKKYTEKGAVWFAINSSAAGQQGHLTPEMANAIIKDSKSFQTAILLDHDGTVGKLYGAKTTPNMFVINPEGTLIYAGAIDDTNSVDPDDIKTSKNYVVAALDAAMTGKQVEMASTEPYGCSVKYKS